MKKSLLLLFTLILYATSAAIAETVTVEKTFADGDQSSTIVIDDNISMSIDQSNGTAPAWNAGDPGLRIYRYNVVTISSKSEDILIKKISFTCSSSSYLGDLAADKGSLSDSGSVKIWTGSSNKVVLTNNVSKNVQLRTSKVEVTYEKPEEGTKCTSPTISIVDKKFVVEGDEGDTFVYNLYKDEVAVASEQVYSEPVNPADFGYGKFKLEAWATNAEKADSRKVTSAEIELIDPNKPVEFTVDKDYPGISSYSLVTYDKSQYASFGLYSTKSSGTNASYLQFNNKTGQTCGLFVNAKEGYQVKSIKVTQGASDKDYNVYTKDTAFENVEASDNQVTTLVSTNSYSYTWESGAKYVCITPSTNGATYPASITVSFIADGNAGGGVDPDQPEVTVAAPTISFDAATNTVTLITNQNVEGGAMVETYYTTNGDDPKGDTHIVYEAPFAITADCTVKAVTYYVDENAEEYYSDVVEKAVTYAAETCTKPTITVKGMEFDITGYDQGCEVWYDLYFGDEKVNDEARRYYTTESLSWYSENDKYGTYTVKAWAQHLGKDGKTIIKSEIAEATVIVPARLAPDPADIGNYIESDYFKLVTSADQLKAGRKLVFVGDKGENKYVMGNEPSSKSSKNFNGIEADKAIVDGFYINSEEVVANVVTLLGDATDGWYFKTADCKWLAATGSDKSCLEAVEGPEFTVVNNNQRVAAISYTDDGVATIEFKISDRNILCLNINSTSHLFNCYSKDNINATMVPVAIYQQSEERPDVKVTAPQISYNPQNNEVTIETLDTDPTAVSFYTIDYSDVEKYGIECPENPYTFHFERDGRISAATRVTLINGDYYWSYPTYVDCQHEGLIHDYRLSAPEITFVEETMTVVIEAKYPDFPDPMENNILETSVHYTINGDEPTLTSPKYDYSEIPVENGDVIKAVTFVRYSMDSATYYSDCAEYTVEVFEVQAPEFEFDDETRLMTLTAEDWVTEGDNQGFIYYTTDGYEPDMNDSEGHTMGYYEPFEINRNCTIKAIFYQYDDNWVLHKSKVVELYVKVLDNPEIHFDPKYNKATIDVPEYNGEGVFDVYYTINGDDPSNYDNNIPYTENGPITITKNCTVRAISMVYQGEEDNYILWSDEVTLDVKPTVVDAPVISVEEGDVVKLGSSIVASMPETAQDEYHIVGMLKDPNGVGYPINSTEPVGMTIEKVGNYSLTVKGRLGEDGLESREATVNFKAEAYGMQVVVYPSYGDEAPAKYEMDYNEMKKAYETTIDEIYGEFRIVSSCGTLNIGGDEDDVNHHYREFDAQGNKLDNSQQNAPARSNEQEESFNLSDHYVTLTGNHNLVLGSDINFSTHTHETMVKHEGVTLTIALNHEAINTPQALADDEADTKVVIGTMSAEASKITPTGVEDITVDGDDVVEYYNLQGVRIERPAKGQVVIARRGNIAKTVLF